MGEARDLNAQTETLSLWKVILVVAVGCLVYGVMQGVHDNYGIMMKALVPETGVSYGGISTAIGIGAFLYGVMQFVYGVLAMRTSHAFVMKIGIALMIIGLVVTPLCRSFATIVLFFGIILPVGTAALGFGITMSAITPIIGKERAAGASGIVQASAGIGDALMSPFLQALISHKGVFFAMSSFALLIAITLPAVFWIGRKDKSLKEHESSEVQQEEGVLEALRKGFANRAFIHVLIGFATCGFNMSIIESHLFSQYVSWGIPESAASMIMTIYGIMTMVGAMLTGFLSMRLKPKNVLGSVYLSRTFISLAMLLVPGSMPFAILATALLGMSGDSTVPPTTSIITREFGAKKMALYYGLILIGHQIGAFFSSWLGGFCVEHFGSYQLLWIVNMLLTFIAAMASYTVDGRHKGFTASV